MKNKSLLACAFAMLVGVLTLFVATAAADQASGTWKMNTEKSKYSPGPAPKSVTVVVESDDTNYKIDATGTDADGKPIQFSTARNLMERTIPLPASPMLTPFR